MTGGLYDKRCSQLLSFRSSENSKERNKIDVASHIEMILLSMQLKECV